MPSNSDARCNYLMNYKNAQETIFEDPISTERIRQRDNNDSRRIINSPTKQMEEYDPKNDHR